MNRAGEWVALREGYLLGHEMCVDKTVDGVSSSSVAPMVTGIIGLMWSVNYCLSSYEVESILKLSSKEVETLTGNQPYKGLMGAGRVNAYRAVKMSEQMKDPFGKVVISNRDFYRFDFTLSSVQNTIEIKNQSFRDATTVDFKAKNKIIVKPGTHLKPNTNGVVKLASDPKISSKQCSQSTVTKYTYYNEDH